MKIFRSLIVFAALAANTFVNAETTVQVLMQEITQAAENKNELLFKTLFTQLIKRKVKIEYPGAAFFVDPSKSSLRFLLFISTGLVAARQRYQNQVVNYQLEVMQKTSKEVMEDMASANVSLKKSLEGIASKIDDLKKLQTATALLGEPPFTFNIADVFARAGRQLSFNQPEVPTFFNITNCVTLLSGWCVIELLCNACYESLKEAASEKVLQDFENQGNKKVIAFLEEFKVSLKNTSKA